MHSIKTVCPRAFISGLERPSPSMPGKCPRPRPCCSGLAANGPTVWPWNPVGSSNAILPTIHFSSTIWCATGCANSDRPGVSSSPGPTRFGAGKLNGNHLRNHQRRRGRGFHFSEGLGGEGSLDQRKMNGKSSEASAGHGPVDSPPQGSGSRFPSGKTGPFMGYAESLAFHLNDQPAAAGPACPRAGDAAALAVYRCLQ